MENDKITAEWARKTANEILGVKVKTQIEQCLKFIEGAVSRNELSTSISMYADKLTIKELEKRGFSVKQQNDQRDGSYLTISW